MKQNHGFTLIELMIVIAIIGILAAVAIPMYRGQTCKAKLTEVTRAISYIATAVGVYYYNNAVLPPSLNNASEIYNTLGASVSLPRIGEIWWVNSGPGNRYIEVKININDCPDIDGKQLRLVMTSIGNGNDPLVWDWQPGSTNSIEANYIPKR